MTRVTYNGKAMRESQQRAQTAHWRTLARANTDSLVRFGVWTFVAAFLVFLVIGF